MKNILIASVAIVLISIIGEQSFSQLTFGDIAKNDTRPINERSVEIKAVRNFRQTYPEVGNASWSMFKGYYIVKFTIGGIAQKIVYTKKGSVDYSLKMYHEKDLPIEIRQSIKSVYYDYRISTAQKLHINREIIYIVQLEGPAAWKTLRIKGNDIEEIDDLRKK